MKMNARIDEALEETLGQAMTAPCPPRLAEAIHYAVFPGGGRVRPGLCLAVAAACGNREKGLVDAAAVAVELLHCASLVQDDLPCFDDAATRRGQPSLHRHFGQEIAVLVGDVLIVTAFRAVGGHIVREPVKSAAILGELSAAAGAPAGIAAGQAWESEANVDLAAYQHQKTAALFEAAAACGAIASGATPEPWRATGGLLGEAYQIADDLADALGEAPQLGKPIHKDGEKRRPSIVTTLGVDDARQRLESVLAEANQSIPACPGRADVEGFLSLTAKRLCPPGLAVADGIAGT
jgi:geranylgeranyl diphosphate synthase type II